MVAFFQIKVTTFIKGQEPQSPPPEQTKKDTVNMGSLNPQQLKKHLEELKEKELFDKGRKTKTFKDNFVTIEEEFKITEMGAGVIIGELAMMDPKATRALSGMAKTDCIFLLLNHDSFDILVKVTKH